MNLPPCFDLVTRVTEQKALAQRNRSIRIGLLLAAILAAGLAWTLWYLLSPAQPQALKLRVIACAAAAFLLHRLLRPQFEHGLCPRQAACPQCGRSWEIKEGRGVMPSEIMTNWDKCPGCGLLMTEALLKKQLEKDAS